MLSFTGLPPTCVQPALLGVGGSGGAGSGSTSRPEAARQFDKAKLYYTLLTYSVEVGGWVGSKGCAAALVSCGRSLC